MLKQLSREFQHFTLQNSLTRTPQPRPLLDPAQFLLAFSTRGLSAELLAWGEVQQQNGHFPLWCAAARRATNLVVDEDLLLLLPCCWDECSDHLYKHIISNIIKQLFENMP